MSYYLIENCKKGEELYCIKSLFSNLKLNVASLESDCALAKEAESFIETTSRNNYENGESIYFGDIVSLIQSFRKSMSALKALSEFDFAGTSKSEKEKDLLRKFTFMRNYLNEIYREIDLIHNFRIKKTIKLLISDNQTERSILMLLDYWTNKIINEEALNSIIIISSNFRGVKNQLLKNLIEYSKYQIEISKINNSLLIICDTYLQTGSK